MQHVGDDRYRGSKWNHWETLRSLLRPSYATGVLADEEACKKEPLQGTKSLVGSKSAQEEPLVLKLLLHDYRPRLDSHKQNVNRGRNFSRVRP